jgi:hypothetical protein
MTLYTVYGQWANRIPFHFSYQHHGEGATPLGRLERTSTARSLLICGSGILTIRCCLRGANHHLRVAEHHERIAGFVSFNFIAAPFGSSVSVRLLKHNFSNRGYLEAEDGFKPCAHSKPNCSNFLDVTPINPFQVRFIHHVSGQRRHLH